MKPSIPMFLLAIALTAFAATDLHAQARRSGRSGRAREAAASAAPVVIDESDKTFSPFNLILKRNIFDPDRVPPPPLNTAIPTPTPLPMQNIDLLGTWVLDDRKVAFVDGDPAAAKGEVALGGAIGGLKVEAISTDGVVLGQGEKKLDLPVGQRLQRTGTGEWSVAEGRARTDSAPASGRTRVNNNNNNNGTGFNRGANGGGFNRGNNGGGFNRNGGFNNNPGGGRGNAAATAPSVAAKPATPPSGKSSEEIMKEMMAKRAAERAAAGGAAATPAPGAPAGGAPPSK